MSVTVECENGTTKTPTNGCELRIPEATGSTTGGSLADPEVSGDASEGEPGCEAEVVGEVGALMDELSGVDPGRAAALKTLVARARASCPRSGAENLNLRSVGSCSAGSARPAGRFQRLLLRKKVSVWSMHGMQPPC